MTKTNSSFRGNPRHLSLLAEAAKSDDIARWNSFVRKNGQAFRARLAGAVLSGLDLGEARLVGADLSEADLHETNLSRADLSGARLRGANLRNVNLKGARLLRTDLSEADLTDADLRNTRARGAILQAANLTNADLAGADLSQASLSGASVTGTKRIGARMKVRVKVSKKGSSTNTATGQNEESREGAPAWIRAKDDQEDLKRYVENRENRRSAEERERLDRKLGRKKPLFKRVK